MVALEVTEATMSGPKLSMAIDPRTISETNSAPEMGALYAAAIPAAPPQATISRNRGIGARASNPSFEPSIADSCTMGPSRPMDPPEAIDRSDERLFARVDRRAI